MNIIQIIIFFAIGFFLGVVFSKIFLQKTCGVMEVDRFSNSLKDIYRLIFDEDGLEEMCKKNIVRFKVKILSKKECEFRKINRPSNEGGEINERRTL